MITEISTEYVDFRTDHAISRVVSVDVTDTCILTGMLLDSGDGYRPFSPLEGTVNGVAMAIPMTIAAGTHVFSLTGEAFEGIGLMLTGHGLHVVTRISVVETNNSVSTAGDYVRGYSIIDTGVLITGEDYALPAAFTLTSGYAVTGRVMVGDEDVGFGVTKGNGTVNIKPFKGGASIDILVTRNP
jgi:hypothetical protein